MKSLKDILDQMSDLPEFYITENLSVNTRGIFGNTPLHVAAMQNDTEAIITLLANGADILALGEDGFTPKFAAADLGNFEALELLRVREQK
jgi:ankyrin repeat protein